MPPEPQAGRGGCARPGPGEVVVALQAAALNRRDFWIRIGKYGGIRLPAILGSDGAGVVTAVGAGVPAARLGSEVIINPSLAWGSSPLFAGEGFRVLGMPDDGVCRGDLRLSKPACRQAGASELGRGSGPPLAGLTAYRALCVRGRLRPGETVLIPGIGSGVSTMAMVLAKHLGARVIVTSGSDEKRARALTLGADFAVNHRSEGWDDQIRKWCGGALPNGRRWRRWRDLGQVREPGCGWRTRRELRRYCRPGDDRSTAAVLASDRHPGLNDGQRARLR